MIDNTDLNQLLMKAAGQWPDWTTAELIDELYEDNCVGCCMHIVTDDFNIEDEHVQFCIDYAKRKNHALCLEIGERLLELTEEERRVVLNVPDYIDLD
jgi:hypothetical protein